MGREISLRIRVRRQVDWMAWILRFMTDRNRGMAKSLCDGGEKGGYNNRSLTKVSSVQGVGICFREVLDGDV